MKRLLTAAFICLTLAAGAAVQAQEGYTEEAIVALAASQYPFSQALEAVPDWTAHAFDANTVYGIWRVQFWNASGELLFTADLDPESGDVLATDGIFPATESQLRDGRDVVYDFVADSDVVASLIDDLDEYDTYIDYDAWQHTWGMWIEDGYNSLYAVVRFGDGMPWTLDEPELLGIGFAGVPDYEEWYSQHRDEAIALAYNDAAIAAAVRPFTGWEAVAIPVEGVVGDRWMVEFSAEGSVVARANVDLAARAVETLDG